MTIWVAGIDPSLTGTGFAAGALGQRTRLATFGSRHLADGPHARVERYQTLIAPIMREVLALRPALIVVEDYNLVAIQAATAGKTGRGGGAGKAAERIGLAEVLRFVLVRNGLQVCDVAPTSLKAFASNSGSTPDLTKHVNARWNLNCADDNQADAAACMHLGFCLLGMSAPEPGKAYGVVSRLRKAYPQLRRGNA